MLIISITEITCYCRFPELNPPLLRTAIDVECMKPKIAEQVVNLAQNLNK